MNIRRCPVPVWRRSCVAGLSRGCLAGWIPQLAERMQVPVNNVTSQMSYITALYFTCTSLTSVGFGNVSANTNSEKIFSIIVMLVGGKMRHQVPGEITFFTGYCLIEVIVLHIFL